MTPEPDSGPIAMQVGGIVVDPSSQVPVVVLRGVEEPRLYLPIFIGGLEATSIATLLADVAMPRPMTHDLMTRFIAELGGRVERVTVTRLAGGTFFAEVALVDHAGAAHVVDARPSDGIALALRVEAPIFVARAVVLEAGAMADEDAPDAFSGGGDPGGDDADDDLADDLGVGDDDPTLDDGLELELDDDEGDDDDGEAPTKPATPTPTVVTGRDVRLEELEPEDFGDYEM